jgi:O-antigen/teichoic acid export membrane protein
MTFVAVFLINAALSFALSLVVAYLVGPEAFGRYAVALSLSVVVNTALFEWLRLSATRFYSERISAEEPSVRTTLDILYGVTSGAVLLGGAVVLLAGFDLGLPAPLLAAALAVGLSVGLFDYRTALARARFQDRRYAVLLLARGCAAFALASAAAAFWSEPVYVLGGSALAAFAVIALLPERTSRPPGGRVRGDLVASYARYALPLVAASAVYQLLPLMNRSVLAARAGFEEAGYLALAGEIAVRLFQNVGSALDLALFQLAVRADEQHGPEAADRQVARNVATVAAIMVPGAVGLWAVWPSFEALVVPPAFRGHVADTMTLAIPAFAAYGLVQYGLNPVFQLRRRTAPVIAAALVALAVNGCLLHAWRGKLDAPTVAAIQLTALGAATAAVAGLALRQGARLPWRDLGGTFLAASLMGAALAPWRLGSAPLWTIAGQVLAGVLIYGAIAVALDVAGARGVAASLLNRARPASANR